MKAKKKALAWARALENGDYLSSRRLTASTFGVKELNFCVRNGNRWILFAIITAMVIYLCLSANYIYTFIKTFYQKIYNYIANLYESLIHIFSSLKLVKIIDFFLLKICSKL